MQSLLYVKGSDGAANASLMTVTTIRAALATTILTNTIANAPAFFYGSMGTPHTFTDPVTGETITVISEASAVDFAGRIDSGHIEIVAIAPGYTDLGSKVGDIIVIRPITEWANNIFNVLNQAHQDDGKLKTTALDAFYKPSEVNSISFVYSGGVIAITAGLTASFSDIIYYIAGLRYTKTGVANRAYTASKDTYVDIDAAGVITYTEVANGAAVPALVAGRTRLAKVVTSGAAITLIGDLRAKQVSADIIDYNTVQKINIFRQTDGSLIASSFGTLLWDAFEEAVGLTSDGTFVTALVSGWYSAAFTSMFSNLTSGGATIIITADVYDPTGVTFRRRYGMNRIQGVSGSDTIMGSTIMYLAAGEKVKLVNESSTTWSMSGKTPQPVRFGRCAFVKIG